MKIGTNFFLAVLLTLGLLTLCPEQSVAKPKDANGIQAELEREANPRKRLNLALDLTDARLNLLTVSRDSEDGTHGHREMQEYLEAVALLEKAIEHDWSRIRKNVEIRLRRQMTTLENYAMAASYTERPAIEGAVKRIAPLHERVLNYLMRRRN